MADSSLYLAVGNVFKLCWWNVIFVYEKHGVGARNVPYASHETTQFICIAVNPCFAWVRCLTRLRYSKLLPVSVSVSVSVTEKHKDTCGKVRMEAIMLRA